MIRQLLFPLLASFGKGAFHSAVYILATLGLGAWLWGAV